MLLARPSMLGAGIAGQHTFFIHFDSPPFQLSNSHQKKETQQIHDDRKPRPSSSVFVDGDPEKATMNI